MRGVHFLLTYQCTSECDHCFLFGSPRAGGTFTLAQLQAAFSQLDQLATIESVYFEGGEPFLYYPLLLAGMRMVRQRGWKAGIVTNCYWATSEDDGALWLSPLAELGVDDLSISEDSYHDDVGTVNRPAYARAAAKRLGIPCDTISIAEPCIRDSDQSPSQGEPILGGDVLFRGRAAARLIGDLPRKPWHHFDSCPHEQLDVPKRIHLDAFGNILLCQGLSIGNIWEMPIEKILSEYRPSAHPIVGPLLTGGPAELTTAHRLRVEDGYVDACHFCFLMRRKLAPQYPQYLTPPGSYFEAEEIEAQERLNAGG